VAPSGVLSQPKYQVSHLEASRPNPSGVVASETADIAPSVVRPRPEPLPAGPTNLLGWSGCFGRRKPLSSGNRILSPWVGWLWGTDIPRVH
jgi:hypothetical protein